MMFAGMWNSPKPKVYFCIILACGVMWAAAPCMAGTTERVSVSTGGAEGNDGSGWPSISADGRYVAFKSAASNLVAGVTNALLGDASVQNSGTEVSADITEETTWQHSGSPYVLTEDIDIAANITLTIEAGVVVRAQDGTSLRAGGRLDCLAAEGNPFVFTSYRDDEYGGDTNGDGGGVFWGRSPLKTPDAAVSVLQGYTAKAADVQGLFPLRIKRCSTGRYSGSWLTINSAAAGAVEIPGPSNAEPPNSRSATGAKNRRISTSAPPPKVLSEQY